MSNRLIPGWDKINKFRNPLTEGEKCLIKFLDTNLPTDDSWEEEQGLENYKGWLIFVQPYLNGSRPDIVVFNPQVGIMIYEVKDWDLNHYSRKERSFYVNTILGEVEIKNPISQVSFYRKTIIEQLVPVIGETVDKNNKAFGVIKIGLYFHKEKTENVENFFKKNKEKKSITLIGYDALNENNLDRIIPDIKFKKSKFWEEEWNKQILFWLCPPYHAIEQGEKIDLSKTQLRLAEPRSGHYRIRGVAGSGKTMVLAYRAANLAAKGYKTLILTYNITLIHYIRDMIQRVPVGFDWSKIELKHFHGFCSEKLNKLGIPIKNKKSEDKNLNDFFNNYIPQLLGKKVKELEQKVKELEEKIERKDDFVKCDAMLEELKYDEILEGLKYDAILIDEGQDFMFEWYKLLNENFLTERDELVVFFDKNQNIYQREINWLDKRKKRYGLEKFGKIEELKISFRLPNRIIRIANEFSDCFKIGERVEISKYQPAPFDKEYIFWRNIQWDDWLEYFEKIYFYLTVKKNNHPSDIVFLLPSVSRGLEAVSFFEKKKIKVNHVFEEGEEKKFHPHKKAFWLGDSRLKMCTIHSFKGWELKNVVLLIPPEFKDESKLDLIVYTAITRTMETLIILNCNDRYKDFVKKEKFPWINLKK